jgi:serine/threonine protein phosphatase PrpC
LQKQIKNGSNSIPNDGSTATIVFADKNNIYITNCGDSACYTVSNNNKVTLMTEDHGTKNTDEIKRVLSGGGSLKEQNFTLPKYSLVVVFLSMTNDALQVESHYGRRAS